MAPLIEPIPVAVKSQTWLILVLLALVATVITLKLKTLPIRLPALQIHSSEVGSLEPVKLEEAGAEDDFKLELALSAAEAIILLSPPRKASAAGWVAGRSPKPLDNILFQSTRARY